MTDLSETIERVYSAFAAYQRPADVAFCSFCYDPEQIELLRTTPLRQLDAELSRLLAWEASDHFDSTDVYKHYLPRILEYLAPPTRGEDIYPEHLFETLKAHRFKDWLAAEREAIGAYFSAVEEALQGIDATAAREWRQAAGGLFESPNAGDA